MKKYPIKGNPSDQDYSRLITLLAESSTHAGLVYRKSLHGDSIRAHLGAAWQSIVTNEWPGTRSADGDDATVCVAKISPSVLTWIQTTVNRLYEWRAPDRLEDLFFLDARSGRVVFTVVSHESEAYVFKDDVDIDQLSDALYEVVDGYAYPCHQVSSPEESHLQRCMASLRRCL